MASDPSRPQRCLGGTLAGEKGPGLLQARFRRLSQSCSHGHCLPRPPSGTKEMKSDGLAASGRGGPVSEFAARSVPRPLCCEPRRECRRLQRRTLKGIPRGHLPLCLLQVRSTGSRTSLQNAPLLSALVCPRLGWIFLPPGPASCPSLVALLGRSPRVDLSSHCKAIHPPSRQPADSSGGKETSLRAEALPGRISPRRLGFPLPLKRAFSGRCESTPSGLQAVSPGGTPPRGLLVDKGRRGDRGHLAAPSRNLQ